MKFYGLSPKPHIELQPERKVILYIAMSLDGFIAKEDDNIDFLSLVNVPGEDFGFHSLIQDIDTLIWGRRTYDKVLSFGGEFPYKNKNVFVISRSKKGKDVNVRFVDNVKELIENLKKEPGKHIYCDGGGEIVAEMQKHALIDQYVISVIPHLLGSGIRLFSNGSPEQYLTFKKSISFPSGLVQLWYDRKVGTTGNLV